MIGPRDIEAAAQRIGPHIRRTPVMKVETGLGLDLPVSLKLELFQHTGSFKARGALNSVLAGGLPDAGIVAASGGNHGIAVAYAAARLGVPARIFVPRIAGETKIEMIRRTGADLRIVEGAYYEAATAAADYQAESGAASIHAYDSALTLAGQGTIGIELDQQLPDIDHLLVAVGGGGLIGGIAAWMGRRVRIVGVEPENCPTLTRALEAGSDVEVEVSGIAANSLGARRIGRMAHAIAVANSIETVTVTDDAIADAQRTLWNGTRVLAEPGGAAALAALTSGAWTPPAGAKIGVVVCGGNIDPAPFANG